MKTLIAKVAVIQQKLNAPKGQFNKFGKYNYRNLEDILEAVKPLLGDLVLTISDDIVAVGDRIYIKAEAKISDGVHSIENTGFAREAATKKGMDDSQITGSTSSYARKYAVAGLLLCDDNKDADSQDNSNHASKPAPEEKGFVLTDTDRQWVTAIKGGGSTIEDIEDLQYRQFIKTQL